MMPQQQSFKKPSYQGHRPMSWYHEAAKQDNFIHDEAQLIAIRALDELWEQLIDFKQKRNRFLGRSLRSPVSPRGLYLWGGVGRGKSFLMDAFFGCLPYKRKKRIHFHPFMADIHRRLNRLKNTENPLDAVAAEIAKEVRVLCFDEFHVSDIADAMILERLLNGLFAHGVVLVATSNFAPDELYPNGLNRSHFLPAIKVINQQLTVLNVDGGIDHRQRNLTCADIYFNNADDKSEQRLSQIFHQLSDQSFISHDDIEILGRKIPVKARSNEVIWFDFHTLCFTERSQLDYLYLAEHYRFVLVSNISQMSPAERDGARRLTWLIDVLYDYRVKWCASFITSPQNIYTEGDFANEFSRTQSRIREMQSQEYLDLPHLTLT
ncbi:MAG: AFG1 family ATPase [Neisseriaceae bacterium]|nr:AFG1 family ATPase [Neisseriaceae bacterium]